MRAAAVLCILAGMGVAACSSLPTAGPTASDIRGQEVKDAQIRFDLVDIDDNVVAALLAHGPDSFQARFKNMAIRRSRRSASATAWS